MTGPEGERYHGWWKIVSVEAARRLEVQDGFADESIVANPELPVTIMRVELSDLRDGVTRMEISSVFASTEDMERTLEMGMEEGIRSAIGQIDAILEEAPTH